MAQRRLRIVTGLAGLLVVAAGDGVLNERAGGVIAAAAAQESEEDFEDAEEYVEEADEAAADAEEVAEDDTSSVGEEESGDEQDAAASDESGAEEEEQAAEGEQAEPEATEEPPPEPEPPVVAQAAPVSKRDRVFQVIAESAKEVLPNLASHSFQFSDSLKALGANSIDRADVIMMTLERLELKVPLVELAKAENIGALADLLAAKLP